MLIKNSFSKKHIVLSATCKCGDATHYVILLKIWGVRDSNFFISEQTSNISNNSAKNKVDFE